MVLTRRLLIETTTVLDIIQGPIPLYFEIKNRDIWQRRSTRKCYSLKTVFYMNALQRKLKINQEIL